MALSAGAEGSWRSGSKDDFNKGSNFKAFIAAELAIFGIATRRIALATLKLTSLLKLSSIGVKGTQPDFSFSRWHRKVA